MQISYLSGVRIIGNKPGRVNFSHCTMGKVSWRQTRALKEEILHDVSCDLVVIKVCHHALPLKSIVSIRLEYIALYLNVSTT